jgi:hypothetical protein
MPVRIAIIDRRIPQQADVFRPALRTWVAGARETLEVDTGDTPQRITEWAATQGRRFGSVDIDLIAHGAGGDLQGVRVYCMQLGNPGFYERNVHLWNGLQGKVQVIRVFTCGALSPAFPDQVFRTRTRELIRERFGMPTMAPRPQRPQPPTPVESQHQLMATLAQHSRAEVRYSLHTMLGAVQAHAQSQSFATDPLQSPAFTITPGNPRRALP